jgi:hypothetical protein
VAEIILFTSNFAKQRHLPSDLFPLGIACGAPGWFKSKSDMRLAPTRDMLDMTEKNYDRNFFKILAGLDPEEIYRDVTKSGARKTAMLCWCARNCRCHRRYVAEWIEVHLGIVVPEFGTPRDQTPNFLEWD